MTHHISKPGPIAVPPPRTSFPLFMVPRGNLSTTYKSGTEWEERTGVGKGELARKVCSRKELWDKQQDNWMKKLLQGMRRGRMRGNLERPSSLTSALGLRHALKCVLCCQHWGWSPHFSLLSFSPSECFLSLQDLLGAHPEVPPAKPSEFMSPCNSGEVLCPALMRSGYPPLFSPTKCKLSGEQRYIDFWDIVESSLQYLVFYFIEYNMMENIALFSTPLTPGKYCQLTEDTVNCLMHPDCRDLRMWIWCHKELVKYGWYVDLLVGKWLKLFELQTLCL